MDLVVSGKLKPILDKAYPLKEVAAQERLWQGENFREDHTFNRVGHAYSVTIINTRTSR